MITAAQAIEIADRDGFCELKPNVYLWKTCEAVELIRFDDVKHPYMILSPDPVSWKMPIGVKNSESKALKELCNVKV